MDVVKIVPESRPKKIEALECQTRDLGDEILAYDRERGKVHVLNTTARQIYELCDGSRTVGEIAKQMASKYEIDAEKARCDVLATIERLVQLSLIEVVP